MDATRPVGRVGGHAARQRRRQRGGAARQPCQGPHAAPARPLGGPPAGLHFVCDHPAERDGRKVRRSALGPAAAVPHEARAAGKVRMGHVDVWMCGCTEHSFCPFSSAAAKRGRGQKLKWADKRGRSF
eukprot:351999-Chlamydomonas_euryale.AAC.5